MAMRPPIFTKSDLSSADAATRGRARAAEDATMGLNPSKHKRETIRLTANSAGAGIVELFILGQLGYRLRLLQSSVVCFAGVVVYHSSVSRVAWHVTVAAQNIDGVLTLVGVPLLVKYGAAAAALSVIVDNPTESFVITGAGVAGDLNGRWEMFIDAFVEVTEDAK